MKTTITAYIAPGDACLIVAGDVVSDAVWGGELELIMI